jgi:hypothetical protein
MRVRRSVSAQFEWLLRLGNISVLALLAMILGVIILALHFSDLLGLQYQPIVGGVLLGAGTVVGAACFIVYWVLQNRLSGAEILARTVAK